MTYEQVKDFPSFRRRTWEYDTFVVCTELGYKLSTPERLTDWQPSKAERRKNDWEVIY